MAFGTWIRTRREATDITLLDFARDISISPAYWSRIERGLEKAPVVLDEVSMVDEDMARDLMSFKKPILVLGDPGQLPPIRGEGAFTRDAPDVMLTEIHRQAEESAIIRLATMARQGDAIGFGQYDAHVAKMRKMDVTPSRRSTAVRSSAAATARASS